MTTADACELLVDMTRQCSDLRADLASANEWLRAFGVTCVRLTHENATLKEHLRRERQQHADLRHEILLAGEPV